MPPPQGDFDKGIFDKSQATPNLANQTTPNQATLNQTTQDQATPNQAPKTPVGFLASSLHCVFKPLGSRFSPSGFEASPRSGFFEASFGSSFFGSNFFKSNFFKSKSSDSKKSLCFSLVLASLLLSFSGEIAKAEEMPCVLGGADACASLVATPQDFVVLSQSYKDTTPQRFDLDLHTTGGESLTLKANKAVIMAPVAGGDVSYGANRDFDLKDSVYDGNIFLKGNASATLKFSGNYAGEDLAADAPLPAGTGSVPNVKGYAFMGNITANNDGETHIIFDNAKMKESGNIEVGFAKKHRDRPFTGKFNLEAINGSEIGNLLMVGGRSFDIKIKDSKVDQLFSRHMKGTMTLDNSTLRSATPTEEVKIIANNHSTINNASISGINRDEGLDITLNSNSTLEKITISDGIGKVGVNGGSKISEASVTSGGLYEITLDNSTLEKLSFTSSKDNNKISTAKIIASNASKIAAVDISANGIADITFVNPTSSLETLSFSGTGGTAKLTNVAYTKAIENTTKDLVINIIAKDSILGVAPLPDASGKIPAPTPILNVITSGSVIKASFDNTKVYGNISWTEGSFGSITDKDYGIHFTNGSELQGNIQRNKKNGTSTSLPAYVDFKDSAMVGDIRVDGDDSDHLTAGKANVTFQGGKFSGEIISNNDNAEINIGFDGTQLDIGRIFARNVKNSKITITNASNGKIGETSNSLKAINFKGILDWNLSGFDLGDITNTNADSKIILKDTQGHTYGAIGSSTSTYNGTLIADFDFTPKDGKSLKIGNITLGSANKQVDLKFSFGGFDGSSQAIGALKTGITITGGHYNATKAGDRPSKFTFSNLGELDFSDPDAEFSSQIWSATNINFQGIGEIYLEKTNIILASRDSKGANSVFSIGDTTQGGINAGTAIPVASKILGATFGNAHLEAQDGRFNFNSSKKAVANEGNTFYRLINKSTEETKDGFVANQSSNGDIGYANDNLAKDIAFVFTPGTFRGDQQGYSGTILGGTSNSQYSFYNAGMLRTSQIVNAKGKLYLFNTLLSGVLGQTQSGKKTDVAQTFDYSGNPTSAYGLGIVGGGTHKLSFDFTGNTNPIKFAGSILGGSDKSSDASKQDGSDNTIAIANLQGLDNTKANPNTQGENKQGILNALNNAGFSAINDKSDATTAKIAHFDSVSDDDKSDIVKGTWFYLRGSSFRGNLKEDDYSLNLAFSSTGEANPHSNNDIQSARFSGDSIDLSSNPYDQLLEFSGRDVISNANHSLKVNFGSGNTNFKASNTNANFILKLNSGEAYISVDNIDGFVALSNTSSVKKTANTQLGITNTSLIGDWNLGGNFVFGDTTTGKSSKFYGVLSNTTEADNSISLTLNPHSLYNPSDRDVATYYEGALKAEWSDQFPTIEFKNTDETKNILILNNPEGALEIKGLSDTIRLYDKSSLSSNNTTIKGDLYLKASKLNLSFDSSKGNYYQAGTSNTIDGFVSDSSLSFVGKGSLRSSSYDSATGEDSGSITIKSNSQPFSLTANNTGAKLILNTAINTSLFSGTPGSLNGYNLNIRGTNLEFADTLKTNVRDAKFNFVFAKASETTQNDLLKTSDGSLLTNSAGKNINDYVLSSSLDKGYSEAYFNGETNFTFFGDESLDSLDNSKTDLTENTSLNINLINMGDAFTSDTSKLEKIFTLKSGTTGSKVTSEDTKPKATYTIAGTNIKDLKTSIPTGITATLNATFDNRDLNARDTHNQKYYTNPNAMGNTQLEIAKSSLSGNVVFDPNIIVNLVFLGKNALSDSAKLSGSTGQSFVTISDMGNFNLANFTDLGANVSVFNPTSIQTNLEDKAGVTLGSDGRTPSEASSSILHSLNIVFNAAKEDLKPSEDFDASKVSGTASVDYDTKSTPYLSQDALNQVRQTLLYPMDISSNAIAIDLNTAHIMDKQIGYTKAILTLSFIGAKSLNFDGTTPVIHDANPNNAYNFIDFGKIDPKLFKDEKITGHINWMGRTWQTGTIQNGLFATIDFSNLPDPEIAKNIYEATNGTQRVTFNFGGSVLDNTGNYKMSGSIKQGAKTQDSSYIFSNLGTIDIPTLKDKDGNSLAGKDFYDVLNATINKDNSVLKQTSGSLGISNTSVNGDVIWNSADSTKSRTMKALSMTFSNITPLRGNISGDGQKSVRFFGNASFDKDIFKITEKNKDSMYIFVNAGVLNTATISSILEGNSGEYIFFGSTALNGDITPTATDQTINIREAIIRGEGNALAKIETASEVNAVFGVGSRVAIKNKNAKSVYDFSAFKGSTTPVVATINLDTIDSTKSDGIEKASVKGFDGGVSLSGSINDSDQTFGTTTITSANTYKFSDKASWLMSADSKVAKIEVSNTTAEQNAALYAPTFANVGSVVDLRGNRAQGGSFGGGAILSGAILSSATGASSSSFTPQRLEIQNANFSRAIFRLGVDSATSQADNVYIKSASGTQDNLLQVYLQNRDIPIKEPIVLAQVDNGDKDFFKGATSLDGIYKITPTIIASATPSSTSTTASTTSASATASTPTGWEYFLTGYEVSVASDYTDLLTSTLGTFYRGFRIETNNLNLRMGELRDNPSTQGVWARVINGMGSDTSNNQDLYTTLQAGYDYQLSLNGGRNYIGVSADASLIFSKGDSYTSSGRNLAIGIYNTYLMDNGFYVDGIAKYINLNNRLSIKDSALLDNSTSTLNSNAFLLGAEIGYRYSLDNLFKARITPSNAAFTQGFYIEPQAELIYGYITGANYQVYMNNNSINATLDSNNALISRVGAVLGKKFKTTTGFEADVRVGLSYINELNSGGNVILNQDNKTIDISTPMNNKLNLSLGANLKVNNDWRVYADISRTFLGVYNFDYNLNLGARLSFGKKISALERSIQNDKAKQNKEAKAKEEAKAKAKQEKELKAKQEKEAKIKAKEDKAKLEKSKAQAQPKPSKTKEKAPPKQQNPKNTKSQPKDKNASKTNKK